ncbi:MAG: hypothetical protein WAM96_09215, partial [Candidatus Acidiferrales bacterium]
LDLRANNSNHIRTYNDTGCIIERVLEASAIYCARLDRRSLAMSYQSHRFERRAEDQGKKIKHGAAIETGGEESIQERSEKRSVVVMPILNSKRWTRCMLAARAGVSKNSVYEYLALSRNSTERPFYAAFLTC